MDIITDRGLRPSRGFHQRGFQAALVSSGFPSCKLYRRHATSKAKYSLVALIYPPYMLKYQCIATMNDCETTREGDSIAM